MVLACPLCSLSLSEDSLGAHLRQELGAVQQRLCLCGQCRLPCREDGNATRLAQSSQLWTRLQDRPKPSTQRPHEAATSPTSPYTDEWLPVAVEEETLELMDPDEVSENEDSEPKEAKPRAALDGRVACLRCGKRVGKENFTKHALSDHIPGKPFQCLLCSFSVNYKAHIARHQKNAHGTELTADTFTCSVTNETRQEWVAWCFGDTEGTGYFRANCRSCDKNVRKFDRLEHIATAHYKKPLHGCKKCSYKSSNYATTLINKHVKNVHKLKPGSETVDSSDLEKFLPSIKAMIPQLFDK